MAKSKTPATETTTTAPEANGNGGRKKTECPIGPVEFMAEAKSIPLDELFKGEKALPHDFSTRSFGWRYGEKKTVTVNGKDLRVQIGLNITVIGSKETERPA